MRSSTKHRNENYLLLIAIIFWFEYGVDKSVALPLIIMSVVHAEQDYQPRLTPQRDLMTRQEYFWTTVLLACNFARKNGRMGWGWWEQLNISILCIHCVIPCSVCDLILSQSPTENLFSLIQQALVVPIKDWKSNNIGRISFLTLFLLIIMILQSILHAISQL